MTKNTVLVVKLPANFSKLDHSGLENLHSEMLATASDVGYEVPADFAKELEPNDGTDTNRKANESMLTSFHKSLQEHVAAMPKKDVAADEGSGDTGQAGGQTGGKGVRAAKKSTKPTSPKRAVETAKENTVAKKAKKAAPKKGAAKKANGGGNGVKFKDEQTITWKLAADKGLGCREGSGREERRKILKRYAGKTVGAYVKGGGSHATLNRAATEGVVSVK